MKFTIASFGIIAAFTISADAALSTCAKKIALQLTNIYENGNTAFHYDYCENLHDGRGYTSGIAGFCTGTADAWEVIKVYHKATGGSDSFSKYDSTLKKYAANESGSTSGLSGYCSVWAKLGKSDSKFKSAQNTIRDRLYYNPSQSYAKKYGFRLDVTAAQLYDTILQHGEGDDPDSLGALLKRTDKSFTKNVSGSSGSTITANGHKVDEIVWLTKFLQVRMDDLKNPANEETQEEWADSITRVKSYQYIVKNKQYKWTSSVKALNNDGKVVTVKC